MLIFSHLTFLKRDILGPHVVTLTNDIHDIQTVLIGPSSADSEEDEKEERVERVEISNYRH